jgi:hypothetical protein
MTERHEHLPELHQETERTIGELAIRPRNEDLFGVSSEEVTALLPSTIAGSKAFVDVFDSLTAIGKRAAEEEQNSDAQAAEVDAPAQPEAASDEDTSLDDIPFTFNRSFRRKIMNAFGKHIYRVVQRGAMYVASYEDHESGVEAGRVLLSEKTNNELGDIYMTHIVPGAKPVRHLRQQNLALKQEMHSLLQAEGPAAEYDRYTVLKALGYSRLEYDTLGYEKASEHQQPPRPEFILAAMYAMERDSSHKQLLEELHAGTYDRAIARDIVRFIRDADVVEGDLSKVQQLAKCLYFFSGQPTDLDAFYERMVNELDNWPQAQRQVVIDSRQHLRDRLDSRLNQVERTLRQGNFILDDPATAFKESCITLTDEIMKRQQVNNVNKPEIMLRRTTEKRGRRLTTKRERRQANQPVYQYQDSMDDYLEKAPEAAEVVLCNVKRQTLEDRTVAIEEFVSATSQGAAVREDVGRMLDFLARRDIPVTQRHSIKALVDAHVRFGTEENPDKLWRIFRFKPTMAPELSIQSTIAKNARVYFIKMDDGTIGVLGVKLRSEQDEFLRSVQSRK